MGVHMLVCKSLPPDVEGTFCCLFTVCYPSSFCLRQLHRNAECCSALFFAFSSSVYFFSLFPPFRYLDAELGFILACEGDFLGTDVWWWLSGCPLPGLPSPHAGTHWEVPLASTPNCSDASWQLRSHPGGALSRSMSRSCAFISGSVVKNKAFQHIKYPFGNWERKAPSPSCVSGCSGRALGEPLPHSSVSVRQSLVGALEQILGAVGKG